MRDLRGREISMIFQNPRAALNPIRKVGRQIEDVLRQHVQAADFDARRKAIEVLEQVRIARPEERYHAYPFELSGGMCQRIVIALALACRPQLLIADEPTTGLDVTTQKAVMELIVELTRERGMSTILITHDLGLAAAYADRVVVMEKGQRGRDGAVVDDLPRARARLHAPADAGDAAARRQLARPAAGGWRRRPRAPSAPKPQPNGGCRAPLLAVEGSGENLPEGKHSGSLLEPLLQRARPAAPAAFHAVDGISFTVGRGESVGLVGESGCGKSTTSMMVMRLIDKTSGRIMFDGVDIGAIRRRDFASTPCRRASRWCSRTRPTASIRVSPRPVPSPIRCMRFASERSAQAIRARCEELATQVGLPLDLLDRFPHQLSGGQKARVGIARAIALNPDLVDSRRADGGTRRLGAGRGPQPAAGSQGPARHELSVRLARSQCGAPAVRSCHRHEKRPDRRAGADGQSADRASDRLHARAVERDPQAASLNGGSDIMETTTTPTSTAIIEAAAKIAGLSPSSRTWLPRRQNELIGNQARHRIRRGLPARRRSRAGAGVRGLRSDGQPVVPFASAAEIGRAMAKGRTTRARRGRGRIWRASKRATPTLNCFHRSDRRTRRVRAAEIDADIAAGGKPRTTRRRAVCGQEPVRRRRPADARRLEDQSRARCRPAQDSATRSRGWRRLAPSWSVR